MGQSGPLLFVSKSAQPIYSFQIPVSSIQQRWASPIPIIIAVRSTLQAGVWYLESGYCLPKGAKKVAKPNTVQKVEEIVKPFADELGLEIWDITFKKEGNEWYLRIFIDKADGVNIDDCVDLTHAVSKPIDDADPISQNYMLEISSPGVERELKRDEHFEKYIGSPVMVRTIRPIDGVRDFNGKLTAYEHKKISLELQDGSVMTFDKKDTNYVKLDDFDINDFV